MLDYIGRVGVIIKQTNELDFFSVKFDNVGIGYSRRWAIHRNDLKPLREDKLKRILKDEH